VVLNSGLFLAGLQGRQGCERDHLGGSSGPAAAISRASVWQVPGRPFGSYFMLDQLAHDSTLLRTFALVLG